VVGQVGLLGFEVGRGAFQPGQNDGAVLAAGAGLGAHAQARGPGPAGRGPRAGLAGASGTPVRSMVALDRATFDRPPSNLS
jgi:hypothetical protein